MKGCHGPTCMVISVVLLSADCEVDGLPGYLLASGGDWDDSARILLCSCLELRWG